MSQRRKWSDTQADVKATFKPVMPHSDVRDIMQALVEKDREAARAKVDEEMYQAELTGNTARFKYLKDFVLPRI